MADGQAQEPSGPIEIVIGASYPAIITFDDLDGILANVVADIRFELRAQPNDAAPMFVASLTTGEISVAGPDSANLLLDYTDTATIAAGRYHFETWIYLVTNERYRTAYGIANVTRHP